MASNDDRTNDFEIDPETEFDLLIRQARKGDQQAIDLLISNYRRYLLFIAEQRLEPELRTKLGASDIVQETMIKANLNRADFRGETEAEWKAWLRTILENDVKAGRRRFQTKKRSAEKEINLNDQSAIARDLADKNLTPRSNAIEQECAETVRQAIGQLKDVQQKVIHQRNFQQLGFAEIGRNLGMTEDGARKLWARAIESLKRLLDSQGSSREHGPTDSSDDP